MTSGQLLETEPKEDTYFTLPLHCSLCDTQVYVVYPLKLKNLPITTQKC